MTDPTKNDDLIEDKFVSATDLVPSPLSLSSSSQEKQQSKNVVDEKKSPTPTPPTPPITSVTPTTTTTTPTSDSTLLEWPQVNPKVYASLEKSLFPLVGTRLGAGPLVVPKTNEQQQQPQQQQPQQPSSTLPQTISSTSSQPPPSSSPSSSLLPSLPTLRMRQPFKILIDIWGVITSFKFQSTLYEYLDANIRTYLMENLHQESIQYYLEELIRRTNDDLTQEKYHAMPPLKPLNEYVDDNDGGSGGGGTDTNSNPNTIPTRTKQDQFIDDVIANLTYRRREAKKPGQGELMRNLDSLINQIWNDGYGKKSLRPHCFDDVIPNLRKWIADPLFIKVYTYASGPVEIQKLFLSATIEGDVSAYITSGFDAHQRYKYDLTKYRGVLSCLAEREAKNLFYITNSPNKGREAKKAGMTVFIIKRDGNRSYRDERLKPFTVIESLNQFDFYEFDAKPCC